MRKSARLSELPDILNAFDAADADFDGRITANDARIILRVSAGLDMFSIRIKRGGFFKFGYIENLTTAHIDYETSSDKLHVERQIAYAADFAPDWVGAFDRHTFMVSADEPGEYIFKVVRYGFTDEPRNTNVFKITVI
ncbi:MAG: hypothetical protein K6G90_14155 [Clostridia bacterium]|nr:hypothetical protein [Clostridia bacterium]